VSLVFPLVVNGSYELGWVSYRRALRPNTYSGHCKNPKEQLLIFHVSHEMHVKRYVQRSLLGRCRGEVDGVVVEL
jgi:hypothetical protein